MPNYEIYQRGFELLQKARDAGTIPERWILGTGALRDIFLAGETVTIEGPGPTCEPLPWPEGHYMFCHLPAKLDLSVPEDYLDLLVSDME